MRLIESRGGGVNAVRLLPVLSGLNITVPAGSFKIGDTPYELLEEQEYDVVPDPGATTYVHGYLVKTKATDEVVLFVDAFQEGPAYSFTEASPFLLLWHLFHLQVPAGAVEIPDDESSLVYLTVENEEPRPWQKPRQP